MSQVVKNLFSIVLEWLLPKKKEFPIMLILVCLLTSMLIVIIPPEMEGLALALESNWIFLLLSSGAPVTKSGCDSIAGKISWPT